ncbi:MAG: serine hydrolase, partial [Thiobacillus sp.]
MKHSIGLAVVVVCLGYGGVGRAVVGDDLSLPRSSPEAQGMASEEILAFIENAEKEVDALHSIMLVRHGHVVAEGWWAPYAPEIPHMLYSLSKSFTSTAVGMAIAEGRMTVDDLVLSHFPDDAPAEPSAHL